MAIDWRKWAKAADFGVDGDTVRVTFPDQRSQKVRVELRESEAAFRLCAVAARPGAARELDDADVYAWLRNRGSDLVGFRVDSRGRLVGEVWLPLEGLTRAEWEVCVRTLAQRCDRLEYIVTGKDME